MKVLKFLGSMWGKIHFLCEKIQGTPTKFNSSPLKSYLDPKRERIELPFPSIFRGENVTLW